ncbi:DUF4376 domain-containing protein [uncultured Methylobacterium sp.]|uniref:DUF4376 domain-containing protein n=1 Tax=uncultured Methylobacterium sp. TaxID=157278 RepID=UPI0035CB0BE4
MARTALITASSLVADVIEAGQSFVLVGFTQVSSETAEIGDAYDPATGTFSPPGIPLATLRAEASAQVMATRAARIVGGFTFQGVRYQTRDDDRENIAGAAQLAFMALVAGAKAGDLFWDGSVDPVTGAPVPFAWIAEDNGTVTMDAPTMVAFGKAAAAFKQGCIFAAFTLKGAIERAPDAAALAAIDLTQGWPA